MLLEPLKHPQKKKNSKPMTYLLLGITLNAHYIDSLSATFLIIMNANMVPGTILHRFNSSMASDVNVQNKRSDKYKFGDF